MLAKDRASVISVAQSRARVLLFKDEVDFIPIPAPGAAPAGADNAVYCWRDAATCR